MFDDTWVRFRALEQTSGPTASAIDEWRRGRERYAVWALRVIDPAVTARMSAVAERLGDSLVRVRSEDAHVTAWVCGFPAAVPTLDDDVADAILDAQRAAVSLSAAAAPRGGRSQCLRDLRVPRGPRSTRRPRGAAGCARGSGREGGSVRALPAARHRRAFRRQPARRADRARAGGAARGRPRRATRRSRQPCRADRAGRPRARSTNDRLVSAGMISADGPPRDLGRREASRPDARAREPHLRPFRSAARFSALRLRGRAGRSRAAAERIRAGRLRAGTARRLLARRGLQRAQPRLRASQQAEGLLPERSARRSDPDRDREGRLRPALPAPRDRRARTAGGRATGDAGPRGRSGDARRRLGLAREISRRAS